MHGKGTLEYPKKMGKCVQICHSIGRVMLKHGRPPPSIWRRKHAASQTRMGAACAVMSSLCVNVHRNMPSSSSPSSSPPTSTFLPANFPPIFVAHGRCCSARGNCFLSLSFFPSLLPLSHKKTVVIDPLRRDLPSHKNNHLMH